MILDLTGRLRNQQNYCLHKLSANASKNNKKLGNTTVLEYSNSRVQIVSRLDSHYKQIDLLLNPQIRQHFPINRSMNKFVAIVQP